MDAHPYRTFIEQQAKRAEDDLAAFRSRSLTVISTSAGVVALITGLTAFSATKAKNEGGLPIAGVVFVGLALVCFLIASTLALLAQQSGKVETPDNDDMIELADRDRWYGTNDAGTPDTPDQERVTAKMTAKYAVSVHNVAQQAADYMDSAITSQIVALLFSSIAAVIFLVHK